MREQYHEYNFHSEAKYPPTHAMVVTPGFQMNGGFALDRESNASSISQLSYSSGDCLSIPTSPVDNMPYSPVYENNSQPPQQYHSSYNGYFQQTESVRHTPSSLGWSQGTELVKLYKFIVPKGKLPYFELLEKWTPTYNTPTRVYLDEAK